MLSFMYSKPKVINIYTSFFRHKQQYISKRDQNNFMGMKNADIGNEVTSLLLTN